MMRDVRYADSQGYSIAYEVFGSGPRDVVFVHGWVTNIELLWEHPKIAEAMRRLGSFCRVIHLDKRGTGLSDRVPVDRLPTLEQRMDDVGAVMDAAGSRRAVLFGHSEGGPMCVLFAATYPERVEGLVLYGTFAVRRRQPGYPWAPTQAERDAHVRRVRREWGGVVHLSEVAPGLVDDDAFVEWSARYLRSSASPAAAAALTSMATDTDVRAVLPALRVPTLLIHRSGDRRADIGGARWMAGQIPDARLIELPGEDHLLWADPDPVFDQVEEFVTGVPAVSVPDRVLLTVVFTDIVDSTALAADLGDEQWRRTLDRHDELIGRLLSRYRGERIKSTGDGVLAAFDGPARAVRWAQATVAAMQELGLHVRAGAHTGEVERRDDDIGGLAVHIAARVAGSANDDEVLVTRTVTDLVTGAGIRFTARGTRALKGVPGQWDLYAAA